MDSAFEEEFPLTMEGDIVRANLQREEQRLSIESAMANARNLLMSRIGDNGDNMYTILMRLISRILADKPENAVDFFEEYCRLVKQGHFIHPEYKIRDVKGAEHEQKVQFSKDVLRRMFQQVPEDTQQVPLVFATAQQMAPLWSQIGFALPPSMDYFIDRQMELLGSKEKVKGVRFWGVIHTLTGNYYVIELERDNLEVVQLKHKLSQEKAEIAWDVIEGLIRATVSNDSFVSDWYGAESMAMEMIERILEGAIPPDTDVDLATAVAIPVMERIVEKAIDEAQEPEVELSVMGSLEVVSCSATVESSELSLNQLKFASARALVEVKLNVRRYYVCSDPVGGGDWTELPGVNLDKIIASREIRRYFKGNLDAPVVGEMKSISTEAEYLRAVLARISMDKIACSGQGDPSGLLASRDVTVYYKATGFRREWEEAKLFNEFSVPRNAAWQKSMVWPGSYAATGGGSSEGVYFGWGMEAH